MRYQPGGAPTVFRVDFGPPEIFVYDQAVFYTVSLGFGPQDVTARRASRTRATSSAPTTRARAPTSAASSATRTACTFAAYDYSNTTGGVLRRYPRTSAVSPCDYGGTTNTRPFGLFADKTNIYWTNQGVGADVPYTKGRRDLPHRRLLRTTVLDTLWTGGRTSRTGRSHR